MSCRTGLRLLSVIILTTLVLLEYHHTLWPAIWPCNDNRFCNGGKFPPNTTLYCFQAGTGCSDYLRCPHCIQHDPSHLHLNSMFPYIHLHLCPKNWNFISCFLIDVYDIIPQRGGSWAQMCSRSAHKLSQRVNSLTRRHYATAVVSNFSCWR